jgi:hypothetical protein
MYKSRCLGLNYNVLAAKARVKLRFRTCVFLVRYGTTRYDTVRHVTEKFRHTNNLEGLFPYVRLRYDAVRYDTARFFFIARVCDFWGNLPCGKRT